MCAFVRAKYPAGFGARGHAAGTCRNLRRVQGVVTKLCCGGGRATKCNRDRFIDSSMAGMLHFVTGTGVDVSPPAGRMGSQAGAEGPGMSLHTEGVPSDVPRAPPRTPPYRYPTRVAWRLEIALPSNGDAVA